MKKFIKFLVAILCVAIIALPVLFAGCDPVDNGSNNGGGNVNNPSGGDGKPDEWVDYVEQLDLDFTTNTKKLEVTVRTYVDGDTTHFDPIKNSTVTPNYNPEDFAANDGYVKARYLAVNTPESTGKIEEWGKKAAEFTRGKLEAASQSGGSIVIESDDDQWNVDSTGGRYMLWIWYREPGATKYRNLNLEILQVGLAIGSSTANNRYGQYGMGALAQAKAYKLYVFSGEKDPDFYYGTAVPVSLKWLRCHLNDYKNVRVSVTGVVATEFDQSVYIQEYDRETGLYFGMPVYYGYPKDQIKDILCNMGYTVNVVGKVQYYETGNSWQISDVQYSAYTDDKSLNSTIVDDTPQEIQFTTITVPQFKSSIGIDFDIVNEETEEITTETVTLRYSEAIMGTTVRLENLYVYDAYMTRTTASYGEYTLYCRDADGNNIQIRTNPLKNNGTLIEEGVQGDGTPYEGKTINVSGVVSIYGSTYQVRVYNYKYIEFIG